MPLPDQSLLETKKQTTPTEYATLLREKGKVFYWERGHFWMVTDYKLAEAVLRNPEISCDRTSFFISRMPNLDLSLIPDFFSVVSKMMVMSDGEEHFKRRKIASLGVDDKRLDHFRPFVERAVHELLDNAERASTPDFVRDIAQMVPSIVLADLFCIDEGERPNFYKWSNNMTQFFGGSSQYRNEDGIKVNDSAANIRNYFIELTARRRKEPKNDFLSVLLKHQSDLGLADDVVIGQAIMMLVAGQVTTTDQICNNIFTLLTEPGILERLHDSPSLIPLAIEEFNRLDPAVTFIFRVAKGETQIGEAVIKPKDVIFISAHAVNRDPKIFERPDECNIARTKNPHFAFGFGPHFCLGAKLARMEMAALFTQLLARFPGLSLDPERPVVRKHHSLAFSGFESIPLRFNRGFSRQANRAGGSENLTLPL